MAKIESRGELYQTIQRDGPFTGDAPVPAPRVAGRRQSAGAPAGSVKEVMASGTD